jgi:hypothetical protein
MDFHSMSLAELKAHCAQLPKGRRIKHYYIKSRAELCYLHDLRKMAKEKNVRGIWGLSKGELQSLLFPENQEWDTSTVSTLQKDHENQNDAQKHDTPQKPRTKKVWIKNVE